jgi:DNA-binding HxlR family transcriptional regulator
MRFNELLRQFNITHATLTKQLKQLASYGVIQRKSYDQIPPKVEYSLTNLGQKLIPTIQALADWGKEFIDYCEVHPHIVEFERPPLYK